MEGKRGQKEAWAGERTHSLGCRKGRGFAHVLSFPDGRKRSPVMGLQVRASAQLQRCSDEIEER